MSNTAILEPINLILSADKPNMAPQRHVNQAREILAGKADTPPRPETAALTPLFNETVMACRAAESAISDAATAQQAASEAAAAMDAALASRHDGLSEADAMAAIRSARDAADLAKLRAERAINVAEQVCGRRKNCIAELGAAVEMAARAAATRAAVELLQDLEAGIDPAVLNRFATEISGAIDTLVLYSGRVASIGGRGEILHVRLQDAKANPSEVTIGYFLRTAGELIELLNPTPAAELPADPILRDIVDSTAKPRRRRAA